MKMEHGQNDPTGAELRQFIERVQHLEAERKEISDQIKEVYSEAKGRGFLVMPIRAIVRELRRDPDDVAEEREIMALYRQALGMQP